MQSRATTPTTRKPGPTSRLPIDVTDVTALDSAVVSISPRPPTTTMRERAQCGLEEVRPIGVRHKVDGVESGLRRLRDSKSAPQRETPTR